MKKENKRKNKKKPCVHNLAIDKKTSSNTYTKKVVFIHAYITGEKKKKKLLGTLQELWSFRKSCGDERHKDEGKKKKLNRIT